MGLAPMQTQVAPPGLQSRMASSKYWVARHEHRSTHSPETQAPAKRRLALPGTHDDSQPAESRAILQCSSPIPAALSEGHQLAIRYITPDATTSIRAVA